MNFGLQYCKKRLSILILYINTKNINYYTAMLDTSVNIFNIYARSSALDRFFYIIDIDIRVYSI